MCSCLLQFDDVPFESATDTCASERFEFAYDVSEIRSTLVV